MEITETVKNRIIAAIYEIGNSGGTITEISRKVKFERHTLSKYLYGLKKDGILNYRNVGKATLWFINMIPIQTIFETKPDQMSVSESILKNIVTNIPIGMIVINDKFQVQFMNEQMEKKYGDLINLTIYKEIFGLKNPLELQDITKILDRQIEKTSFVMKDKNENILEINASKLVNPSGTLSVILIINDITKKKNLEEQLKKSIKQNIKKSRT